MSIDPRYPPEVAQALTALDLACRTLADVVVHLGDCAADAVALAGATDWQTPTARFFHRQTDEWQSELATVRDAADSVRGEADRAHSRALAAAWWGSS